VYYRRGSYFRYSYVYPYYHRRHIFVSLGGYWPWDYNYVRYYWYGWHPYSWYGYYPTAYESGGDTYNYYTYNYSDGTTTVETASGIRPVDEHTFADVRERMAQEAAKEPAPETSADRYFDEGVKAFESGDYKTAAYRFKDAITNAPEDIILPFTYVQALFADGRYDKAAEVLRDALSKVEPDKEGIFFPRGLYEDQAILSEQIDRLASRARIVSHDSDLQLLLGYQLLGIGKLDEATVPLESAAQSFKNDASARILLELIEKIRAESEDEDVEQQS